MKLAFPEKVLDQHAVMLGKTGAGKSSALRHVVEHLHARKKRVCIVDPKGDWWGLKVSADGKGEGLPFIAFGDFKNEDATDVPINVQSGKHVAELIATGNRPAVIGLRGWRQAHMTEFWIGFAQEIFNANQGELYLVVDEVHNFAPKGKILSPQAGECLHWSNRLLSEGRGLGIVCLIASQRPQKVHNDTLTSCETLIAMRVVHAADREAVEEWIKGAGDKEKGKAVLGSLAGMQRGEAVVWSPEIGFGPERVKFPMFETFDSFAPPQLQKKVSSRGWADVDLDEVKQKLATVIEQAQQNDPKALRQRIAALEKERREILSNLEKHGSQRVEIKTVEKPVWKDSQIAALQKTLDRTEPLILKLAGVGDKFIDSVITLRDAIAATKTAGVASTHAAPRKHEGTVATQPAHPERKPVRQSEVLRPASGTTGAAGGSDGMPPRRQKILNALRFFESLGHVDASKPQIAFFCGTTPTSSTYVKDCGALRTSELVTYPADGRLRLTDAGSALARDTFDISTQKEYQAQLLSLLPPRRSKIASALIAAYPDALDRNTLAEQAGTTATSSTFVKDCGAMRTLGVLDYPHDGYVVGTDLLFPPLP